MKSGTIKQEKCHAPDGHVFKQIGTILELIQEIIRTNVLTKFHEDWTINVTPRVKNVSPPGDHIFQPTTNLLTKFHEDQTINVISQSFNKANLDTKDKRRS
ncbi:hypothetical protein DPMN_116100 [Dreissena polymorpha]|uniref:Uncharacterized protein n=1 Tax=Dreissena polymorpha TaxID=45954 RepID=A0A9D4KMG1_DREPO|nr:hypothetical protein DPMN_116100 [Dreissena polymorpha]